MNRKGERGVESGQPKGQLEAEGPSQNGNALRPGCPSHRGEPQPGCRYCVAEVERAGEAESHADAGSQPCPHPEHRPSDWMDGASHRRCGVCEPPDDPMAAAPPAPEPSAARPFAIPVEEFIATKTDAPAPLIGTEDDCVLPAYGLLLLIAKGGKGKTTATIDAVLHFASGLPWLGFEVSRPLGVLFIENEGPREPFRRKLERRLGHWSHPLSGAVHIYDEDWGRARLDEDRFRERLNRHIESNAIDLVIGDPLDTLGMEGVGSPEDTRKMIDRFKAAGLFSRVAWWVPAHSRKEEVKDAIDEVSGAWGQRPDALLALEKLSGDRARLSFPKLKWGLRDGFAYLLAYDAEVESFEVVKEEKGGKVGAKEQIREALSETPKMTIEELEVQTGLAERTVRDALGKLGASDDGGKPKRWTLPAEQEELGL